jgi:hypothetical protein
MEDKTMTNFTKHMIIAAAALTLAAGVAGAQTIQVEVPFGFRVAGTAMPAGSYRLAGDATKTGSGVFMLTSQNTHRSVLAMSYSHDNQKPGGVPTLTFECSGTACALAQVSPGEGAAYRLHTPGLGKDENTRVAVIRAVLVQNR